MVESAIYTLNIPVILGTIIFGAGVIVAYFCFSLRKTSTSRETKHETVPQRTEKKKEATNTGKTKTKKAPENKWIPKNEKQAYSHPWLLTTIKGHTGPILDIDFSSNGKFLASCADEDPDPGDITSATASSSESNKSDDTSESVSSGKSNKGLSRRQRKNRRREDISLSTEEKSKVKTSKVNNNIKTPTSISKKKVTLAAPLGQYLKFERMNATEKVFTDLLQKYVLSYEQMISYGYPVIVGDQYVIICKYGKEVICSNRPTNPVYYPHANNQMKITVLKVSQGSNSNRSAKPIYPGQSDIAQGPNNNHLANPLYNPHANNQLKMAVPKVTHLKKEQYDSGQGSSSSSSSSSSDSGEFLDSEESSSENSSDHDEDNGTDIPLGTSYFFTRNCCRCGVTFHTTDNQYLKVSKPKPKCRYHWGKLQLLTSPDDPKLVGKMFTCCRGKPHTQGCTEAPVHVWDGLQPGVNTLDNFVYTKKRKTPPRDGNYGVYAVDCEMCYTVRGLELTKVTVVGMDGRLVYDSYVKPDTEIVDYNTRFSGVSAKDFKRITPKTLKEVQNDLMGFISADTILIGHGLENDLRALKIVHYRVVDTSHTFPHPNGLPYRWSLKNLSWAVLKRNIQCSKDGHNSYEDACACMELILWQIRQDYKDMLTHPRTYVQY